MLPRRNFLKGLLGAIAALWVKPAAWYVKSVGPGSTWALRVHEVPTRSLVSMEKPVFDNFGEQMGRPLGYVVETYDDGTVLVALGDDVSYFKDRHGEHHVTWVEDVTDDFERQAISMWEEEDDLDLLC